MYAGIDPVSDLLKEAEEFCIANDRMLYAPFLTTAEKWCARHECAVGNPHFYLITKPNKDSFVMDIYTAFALSAARELAVEMSEIHSPHIDARTLGVQTVLKNAEFHIKVNERVVVRVFGAPAYKKINMVALMGPIPRAGLFSDLTIPCIPPEIHLCAMYRILYSPSRFSEWEQTFSSVDTFWEGITANSLVEKSRVVTGGAQDKKDWKHIYATIAEKCQDHEKPIIIGDIAIKRLVGSGDNKRLQIICAAESEKIVSAIASIFGRKVVAIKYPLGLPMDFQTSKYTIYAGEKIPICDIFNSTAFEIIPHETINGICYAAPFVLMRFKLIDYWLHRTIARLTSGISIASSAETIIHLKEWMAGRTIKELFEDWKYIGHSINPAVAKKKLAAELTDTPYPTYYPAKKKHHLDATEATSAKQQE